MSDSTSQGSSGDFRGSREEKRQDETVMLSSDNLSDLVGQAKAQAAPDPAPVQPVVPTVPVATSAKKPNMVIIGVAVLVFLLVVIALVYEFTK